MQTSLLSYGDNLDILRRYLPEAAVDLVYITTTTAAYDPMPPGGARP